MITSNEGELWAVGTYDPLTEKLIVFANHTAMRVVHGVNYLFTATGQASRETERPTGSKTDSQKDRRMNESDSRLLQAGWLWAGSWAGVNNSGCHPAYCGTMGTGTPHLHFPLSHSFHHTN